MAANLAILNEKSKSLPSLKSSVDSPLSLPVKVHQILELKPMVELLKATVKVVQYSIVLIPDMYDCVLATTTAYDKAVWNVHSETTSLRGTVPASSPSVPAK